jgi:hypothetical protein
LDHDRKLMATLISPYCTLKAVSHKPSPEAVSIISNTSRGRLKGQIVGAMPKQKIKPKRIE